MKFSRLFCFLIPGYRSSKFDYHHWNTVLSLFFLCAHPISFLNSNAVYYNSFHCVWVFMHSLARQESIFSWKNSCLDAFRLRKWTVPDFWCLIRQVKLQVALKNLDDFFFPYRIHRQPLFYLLTIWPHQQGWDTKRFMWFHQRIPVHKEYWMGSASILSRFNVWRTTGKRDLPPQHRSHSQL